MRALDSVLKVVEKGGSCGIWEAYTGTKGFQVREQSCYLHCDCKDRDARRSSKVRNVISRLLNSEEES